MTVLHTTDQDAPLVRALRLARALHETFGVGRDNLTFLLVRWRDVAGVALREDVLGLLATMVVTDAHHAQPPMTTAEAADVATDAARYFSTLDIARHEVQRYANRRNATPEQCIRLDALVRRAWDRHRVSEADHAAA